VHEASLHRQVRDVHRQGVIGPLAGDVPEQVRIDPVGRVSFARVPTPVQRLDADSAHQRGYALASPMRPSAPDKKFVLQRQLADPGVQRLDVGAGLALLGRRGEDLGGALHQLGLPPRGPVRMDVVRLCQGGQLLITLECCQRHLGLDSC